MNRLSLTFCLIASSLLCGCSSTGNSQACLEGDHQGRHADPQVEHGRRSPLIDTTGWVLGIPNKILLWDHKVDNHNIQTETVEQVVDYLDSRGLDDVKVRVNQYDPGGEWSRLVDNKSISPGWRYTVGAFNTLGYTLLPGRLFGGDSYNPFTNTLSLYSDVAPLGIAEGAYAKDVSQRQLPGTYAAFQQLPVIGLWHETLATRGAINHYQRVASQEELQHARHLLYAKYGTNVGSDVSGFLNSGSGGPEVIGAVVGHLHAFGENRKENFIKKNKRALTSIE